MDIIARNFFRLLRAGIFDEEEQIEPMSAWKWRRVYQYSLMHDLTAMTYCGIEKLKDQFFLQMPDDLLNTWKDTADKIAQENKARNAAIPALYALLSKQQLRPILTGGLQVAQLYRNPVFHIDQHISIFFPYQTQGNKADKWARDNCDITNDSERHELSYEWNGQSVEHKHRLHVLTNKLLNHTLQNIIEKEFRENEATYITVGEARIEVPSHTLSLLLIMLSVAQYILSNGVSLKHIADMGIYLREAGDKVDFVKLQSWIDKLRMKRIAQLSGLLLMELLHFTPDELPFMNPDEKQASQKVMNELFTLKSQKGSWYFQQGEDIFVHASNSSAMMWHVRQSARNFRYYPSESFTNFFASIAHSLSHIEE